MNGYRQYELDISGMVADGKLSMNIEYNTQQYRHETMQGFMDAYKTALLKLINFCCSFSGRETSPSDFGFKELSINELETFFD
jgi:non-ribosomal peptide synthase protein (TIGR01720 family)